MKFANKVRRKVIFIIGVGTIGIASLSFLSKQYHLDVLGGVVDTLTYPFQKTIHLAGSKLKTVSKYFKDLDTVLLENETLRKQNDQLLYENTILEQYKDENNQLKNLLDMQQRYKNYPHRGASVIGKESGNWYKIFTIDKGKIDNIEVNGVVLASGGLVGHVRQVNVFSSEVITLIDDRSYVSAKVVRTGDTGTLKGDIELTAKGICKMEIDLEAQIVKGDQIVTSHLSDIYPPGIPIGLVEEVATSKNGLTQYAYIKPFVDFKHLTNVLIIEDSKE